MDWFKKKQKEKRFGLRVYFNKLMDMSSFLFAVDFATKKEAKEQFEEITRLWNRGGLVIFWDKAFRAEDIRYVEVWEGWK